MPNTPPPANPRSRRSTPVSYTHLIQIVPAAEVFPYSLQPYTIERPTPDLVRLMDSIEHIGIAEPLIVRPRESGGYEIISGHRRDYCAKRCV